MPNASLGTARIGGTVTNPTVKLDLRQAIDTVVDKAALKLIAEAEKQATVIREQADSLAARVKREGYAQADSLEAKATGVKKIAARIAANRLRKETDAKADALVREANTRSQKLVDDARAKVKN